MGCKKVKFRMQTGSPASLNWRSMCSLCEIQDLPIGKASCSGPEAQHTLLAQKYEGQLQGPALVLVLRGGGSGFSGRSRSKAGRFYEIMCARKRRGWEGDKADSRHLRDRLGCLLLLLLGKDCY